MRECKLEMFGMFTYLWGIKVSGTNGTDIRISAFNKMSYIVS